MISGSAYNDKNTKNVTINISKAEITEYVIAQYVKVLNTESYDS